MSLTDEKSLDKSIIHIAYGLCLSTCDKVKLSRIKTKHTIGKYNNKNAVLKAKCPKTRPISIRFREESAGNKAVLLTFNFHN